MSLNFGSQLFKQDNMYSDDGSLLTSYNNNLIELSVVSGDFNVGYVGSAYDGDIATSLGLNYSLVAVATKYITFTLDKIYMNSICNVYFGGSISGGSGAAVIYFETSEDGASWTDRGNFAVNSGGPTSGALSWSGLINAKYLRLKCDLWLYNFGPVVLGGEIFELSLIERR